MDTEHASADNRIEQLTRDIGWRELGFVLFHVVLGAFIFASIGAELLFGHHPLWVRVFARAGEAVLAAYIAVMVTLGVGWPKLVRRAMFGPEPEPWDEQEVRRARPDEVEQQFDKLARPISWAIRIAGYGAAMNLVLWSTGRLTMTPELGSATALLGLVAALGIWAYRRIYNAYYQ